MSNDLTGKRFGKLSVLHKTDRKKNGSILWHAVVIAGTKGGDVT